MLQKERAAPCTGNSPDNSHENHTSKQIGKQERMLWHFAAGGRIHRFQAEKLGDHCLPSTISSLQRKYRIHFRRKLITVTNRYDTETRVALYWLEGEDLERARTVIGWKEAAA